MQHNIYRFATGAALGILTCLPPCYARTPSLQNSAEELPLTPASSPAIFRNADPVSPRALKCALNEWKENNPDDQKKFVPIPMKTGRSVLIEPPCQNLSLIGPDMTVPIDADEVARVAGEKTEAFLKRFNSKVDHPTRALLPQRILVQVPAHLINDIRFDPRDTSEVKAIKLTKLAFLIRRTKVENLSEKERQFCVAECFAKAATTAMEVPIIEGMDSAVQMDLLFSRGQLYLWAARTTPDIQGQMKYFKHAIARLKEAQNYLNNVPIKTRTTEEPKVKRDLINAYLGQMMARQSLLDAYLLNKGAQLH